jgi:signal transduction histidine kinase
MFRILAVRLTLLYTLLFSLLALVVFSLIYRSLEADLMARVDTGLFNDGHELAAIYQREGLAVLFSELHLEAAEEGIENAFYRVYSPGHQLAETSDLTAWDGLPIRSRLLDDPAATRYETIRLPGRSNKARLLFKDLGGGYILQIGVLLTHEEQLLANFGEVFSGAFALLLICGGSLGFLMARRALAGIEKVRHSADRISRGDMSQPIPASGESVEIENLIHSFNWMQERIQTLISELQGVTNNVAHDLRSPVTRMRGLAETTLTGPQALEEYRDLASAVIEESDRLVGMINTMLEIAETDAGIRPLSGETVDLTEIIRDVSDLYASLAEDQNILFSSNLPAGALIVTGDRSRLQRAFANLLDNAFKFTPRGGRIGISLFQEDGQALVSIEDSGPGISAESLPHIYERFFRGEQSRTTAGSGLGLSLVKAIVKVHGGQIAVNSSPDQGAKFTVSLPL